MNSNPKPPIEPKPDMGPEKIDYFDPAIPVLCASFYQKGLERMVQAGKTMLDLAAQQNALALDTVQKAFRIAPDAPGMHLMNATRQNFESAINAQKTILDIGVEQGVAFAELFNQRDGAASKVAANLADVLDRKSTRLNSSHSDRSRMPSSA